MRCRDLLAFPGYDAPSEGGSLVFRNQSDSGGAGGGHRPPHADGFWIVAADDMRGSDPLLAEWDRMEVHAFWPTQSPMFVTALLPLLSDGPIALLTAEHAGSMVALLPLCRDRGRFSRWRIVGVREVFEPGEALCHGPEGARRLAHLLARQPRPLAFDRIPAESPLIPALRAAMRGRGWVSVRSAMPCPVITLDEDGREPESRFNAGRRSDFRRAARRAAGFGAVTFETLAPRPEEFDVLFDEAVGVESLGWKQDAGTTIAADPGRQEFFRRYFRAACVRGLFRISFMRIDGRAVAMQLAVLWADRYWLFKIGHDARFNSCSPGSLLMLHTLRQAAADGLRAYELLGGVESWITRFWTREQHDCVQLRVYPCNGRGAVAFLGDVVSWLRVSLGRDHP